MGILHLELVCECSKLSHLPKLTMATLLPLSAAKYGASANTPNSTTTLLSLFCWYVTSNQSVIAFITHPEIASSCITWSLNLLWRRWSNWIYQNNLPTALEVRWPYFPLMQKVVMFSAKPEDSHALFTAEQIFLVVLYHTVVVFLPTTKDRCSMHMAKPMPKVSFTGKGPLEGILVMKPNSVSRDLN